MAECTRAMEVSVIIRNDPAKPPLDRLRPIQSAVRRRAREALLVQQRNAALFELGEVLVAVSYQNQDKANESGAAQKMPGEPVQQSHYSAPISPGNNLFETHILPNWILVDKILRKIPNGNGEWQNLRGVSYGFNVGVGDTIMRLTTCRAIVADNPVHYVLLNKKVPSQCSLEEFLAFEPTMAIPVNEFSLFLTKASCDMVVKFFEKPRTITHFALQPCTVNPQLSYTIEDNNMVLRILEGNSKHLVSMDFSTLPKIPEGYELPLFPNVKRIVLRQKVDLYPKPKDFALHTLKDEDILMLRELFNKCPNCDELIFRDPHCDSL